MRLLRPSRLFVLLATLLIAGGAPAAGDKPAYVGEISSGSRADALRKQRQIVEKQIADRSTASDDNEAADSARAAKDDPALALLRSIDAVYVQHLARLDQLRQLEAQAKDADKQLESLAKFAPDEPKPYSFLLLESLRDQLSVEEDREAAIEADKKSAEQLLQTAHDELDSREKARQVTVKKAEKGSRSREEKTEKLNDAELARTLDRARIGLKQTEVELQAARLSLCKTAQKQLAKKIEIVKKDSTFSAEDRDKQLQRFAASEADLKRRRSDAVTRFQRLESERQTAIEDLAEKHAPATAVDAAAEAWRTAGDAYQTEIVLLDQQIENIVELRRFWKRRYELASGKAEPARLAGWLDDLDEFLDQLKDFSRSLENRRNAALEQQGVVARDAHDSTDPDAAEWREYQNTRLRELRDLTEISLSDIHATERSLDRFRGELKSKVEAGSGTFGTSVAGTLKALLAYPVLEVDEQKVTVGRLFVLLAYIAGGVVLAYVLSRLIGRRLLPQLGMHRGAAAALKSIVFYTMCLVFGILSFKLLNIPLAAFAFVGGAAAIAIGFGSQDIMNNFMSGIILLVEQPIRIGDVVEVDDVQGVVQHIGLRSTRLQTDSNHELIVPNKTLIDEQVTNLTLSDNFVQTFVAISVERNVPVQQAKLDMLKVAFAHPMVIKSPRPVVLLKEVDTYWMAFEVHFSLQHRSFMKCAVVQSEILETISEMFKPADEDKSEKPAAAEGEATADVISADVKKISSAAILKELKRARGALKIKA